MSRQPKQGIHYVNLNGTTHELCAIGNGWEQICLLKEIEQYTHKHTFVTHYATMPTTDKSRQQDVISAKSDKYEIVVVKTHIPNVTNILFAPKYRVQIFDKDKNKTNAYMGTMANLIFDMFKDLRAKQK